MRPQGIKVLISLEVSVIEGKDELSTIASSRDEDKALN